MASATTIDKSSRSASAMARLLAKHTNQFVALHKGESVQGKITKLSRSEIIVDVGAKTEAVVLEKDKRILQTVLNMFGVGDTVEVNVLNPESENGAPVVSLRRYLGKLAWKKLEEAQKNKEQLTVTVSEAGKAGFVVTTGFGISGFLPQSQTAYTKDRELQPGMQVGVSVLELNRKDNKVIFSQKQSVSDEDFAAVMKQYAVGQKVSVQVVNVTPAGLVVSLPSMEGFIHVSEVSWEPVSDLSALFAPGQHIDAVIAKFDKENRRLQLSIKRLTKDPFEELLAHFPLDKKISGTVKEVMESGVLLTLENPLENNDEKVEGFIRKEKIPPATVYSVGQKVTTTVSEHDKKRHRITLVPVLLEKPIGYR